MIPISADLITIFNQLTSSELADYNLFDEILSNHYEKFKYLYSLINDIDLTKIDKIRCTSSSRALHVYITPDKVEYLNDIIYSINDNRHNYTFSEYFILDLCESSGKLTINIEMTDGIKEGDIYANRFI